MVTPNREKPKEEDSSRILDVRNKNRYLLNLEGKLSSCILRQLLEVFATQTMTKFPPFCGRRDQENLCFQQVIQGVIKRRNRQSAIINVANKKSYNLYLCCIVRHAE